MTQPPKKHQETDWWTDAAYRALQTVEGMTDRAAAERLGIGHSTVFRWRELRQKGEPVPGPPRGKTRDVLQRFRGDAVEQIGELEAAPYNEAREEEELRRIGEIPDPILRIMERESIAAVIRAQGLRDACRASRLEAEKALDRNGWAGTRPATGQTPLIPQPRPGERKKREAS